MTREELIALSDLNREDNIKYISSEAQGIAIALDSDRYAPTFCKLERAYICGRRKSEEQIAELEAQIEKMKEVIFELLNFEGNLDPYMYECDGAQNGELLKPFTNARELLKDCICKKCKGEGIVRVGYNGWDKNPCPICKGRGYVIRSN